MLTNMFFVLFYLVEYSCKKTKFYNLAVTHYKLQTLSSELFLQSAFVRQH